MVFVANDELDFTVNKLIHGDNLEILKNIGKDDSPNRSSVWSVLGTYFTAAAGSSPVAVLEERAR